MELTNEEIVTKLLTANEVLRLKKGMSFITTPLYDLGDYLKNYKPEPSPYEGKYVFIRDFTTKAAKENYYHGFLNGVLADSSSLIEQQESNFESGNGYIDILLKSRINKALAIIELKQNNNEKQSKVLKAEEAIEQIKDNNYAGEFLSNPDSSDIYIYGICFYQKECTVVVEKLK